MTTTTTLLVTTYNRAAWLDTLLGAVAGCVTPGLEVLVVDNASTDQTREGIAKHAALLPLRSVYEAQAGKRFAVETGVREARGDLVIFADDDIVPATPDWIAAYERAAAAHPEAGFFGGPVLPWTPRGVRVPGWYGRLAPASRAGFAMPEGPVAEPAFIGSNWAARRPAVAAAVGRITEGRGVSRARWTGQETHLQRALLDLGHAGWSVPEAAVRHRVPGHELTFEWLRRWRYTVGRGEVVAARAERRRPPLWRFRKIAENLLALATGGGPHHRREATLAIARDFGFIAGLTEGMIRAR